MDLVVVQIILIFLVLLVGVYHLYLDQFAQPKSNIQVYENPNQLHYGPLKDDCVEIHFELTANNRGNDNGYIDSAKLIGFEFSGTDDFSDPNQIETGTLITTSSSNFTYSPKVALIIDEDSTQILVPKGEVISFKGHCDVHTDRLQLKEIYSEYYSMRAIIEFQCRDNYRQYKRRITTGRIDIW